MDQGHRNTGVADARGRHTLRNIARRLATAFLSGPWHQRTLMARGDGALGTGGRWLADLTFDVVQKHREPPSAGQLEALILHHRAFVDACESGFLPFSLLNPNATDEAPAPLWPVQPLASLSDLVTWLGIADSTTSSAENLLRWFADTKGLERVGKEERLRHYWSHWVERGPRLPRLLEAPKPRLKALQRKVLDDILNHIPPHPAAHGFVRGRSVATHAEQHVRRELVIRVDLEAFFTTVSTFRAHAVFRAAGYPEKVSSVLLGLCTTRTPNAVLRAAPYPEPFTSEDSVRRFNLLQRLGDWHLPQGAPTSPALANLAAFGLDSRLHAFACQYGLTYSRYADDLVFSGDDTRSVGALTNFVAMAVSEEGFRLNRAKTRVMRQHQRQLVTGVVVNQRPAVARADYDALKARLHRLATKGVGDAEPGLRAHLLGQLAWVGRFSTSRARKLEALFSRIAWPSR